jgi:DNA-binding transcriptional ArsR family regulator
MAHVIKERYEKGDIRIARFAKALAHPARIAIIRHLASVESCYFNEISKKLPLAVSTVSQHIAELKSAGLVIGTFEPPKVKYSISFQEWKQARKLLKGFIKIKAIKNQTGKQG